MLIRTTIRINNNLKKSAELKALREDLTLQDIFNRALKRYLESEAKKEAKKIIFKTHNLGVPLNNLKRADYYPNPIK